MKFLVIFAALSAARALEAAEGSSMRVHAKMSLLRQQMAARMKNVGPEETTLMNIEKSILSMAAQKKSQSDQTDLKDFLKEIQNLLDKTLKKNIMLRVNQTQADLESAWTNLSSCTHPADLDYNDAVKSLSSAHIQCREEQNVVWMDYDTTCILARQIQENERMALCNAFQTANIFPNPATTCSMDESTKVPTIGNYLGDMAKFFRSEYDILFEKKRKCDNATNTPFKNEELCKEKICLYYDQKIACDEKQKTMEEKACQLHKTYTCSLFTECYTEKVDVYDGIVSLAQESEDALQLEWKAVLRIECLSTALGAEDSEMAASLAACKEKSYSADEVALSFRGPAPAARGCTETFLQPGTAVFSNHWYSGLPSHAPAESCACTCCRDSEFSPGYPSGAACPYVAGATTATTTTTTSSKAAATTTTTTQAVVVSIRARRRLR